MGSADQALFTLRLSQSPQQELAESADLFDLSEHGFYDLLAQPVAASPSALAEPAAHRLDVGDRLRSAGPADP